MSSKKTFPTPIIGSAISKDGTVIGYRQLGSGKGIILIHGGMMSSHNFMALAEELSAVYTVYVPDRRGRGLSGNYGHAYCIARECEDVDALINKTGSHFVFGLSSGALIALQAAFVLPAIYKVALYEPPLPVNGSNPGEWVARYESELADGNLAAAMTTVIKGTADAWSIGMLPRFILVPLLRAAIKSEEGKVSTDSIPLKDIIPTVRYDGKLVEEMKEKAELFKTLKTETLLLGGNRSIDYLKVTLDALSKILPHSQRVELRGVGHLAAENDGKPNLVAAELKRFFN